MAEGDFTRAVARANETLYDLVILVVSGVDVAFAPPPRVKPVWDFAIHVVAGGAAFLAVLLVAVGLAGVVQAVEQLGFVPGWLIRACEYAEVFIFGVDALLFGIFFLSEAFKLLQSFLKSLREKGD